MWLQTMSILPCGRSLKIPRGREVLKGTLLGEKYEVKLDFFFLVGGWGGGGWVQNKKNLPWGMDIFWNHTPKQNPY